MKKYLLNTNLQEMDYEEAKDWLLDNLHFNLDYTEDKTELEAQNELIEVLLDTYFIVEEVEEDDETDYWADDYNERMREYRKAQGF